MKLQFLGGVQTVTGSKTLLTSGKHKILIDCGLFQGIKELRLKNREPFPIDPRFVDSVLLTHAHLDHTGYLPLLVKSGFRGKIYCSAPTRDLAELILEDSAKIQEEDAEYANRHGYSKHHPAQPLYTLIDVKRTLSYFEAVPPNRWHDLPGHIRFKLTPSGHILGSTFIEVEAEGKRVVFSGDLGRSRPLIYPSPTLLETADFLVIESTYGDRTHHPLSLDLSQTPTDPANPSLDHSILEKLSQIVQKTFERGGQVIIPSFAIGRIQDLLYLFSKLKAAHRLPDIPIYLDSPMGVNATQIFTDYSKWHRLLPQEIEDLSKIPKILRTQKESIEVMREGQPAVVIAGSGMLSGGRVLHHLEARLSEERNTILLVGFQAAGTRGRLLKDGITELKMHGKYIPVRARVEELGDLSAHADQMETLEWLRGFKSAPNVTFINHGEPQASDALRVKIRDTYGWRCEVPHPFQEFDLN